MIDCSITINYFKEKVRMTNSCKIDCEDCPLKSQGYSCYILQREHPEKAIEIVQKWSDAHPQKTYKDDFYDKFPNAKTRYTPSGCVNTLYGCKKYCAGSCEDCWNEVMPDGND